MPANNTKGIVHYYAGRYPGKIGLLLSPEGWRRAPYYLPYALDNGAFTGFDAAAYRGMLRKAERMEHRPLWAAVPDCVGDADETSRMWAEWKDEIPFRLAFVVQDGHRPSDVPDEAYCVFVGGSTAWKLGNAHMFKGVCQWLHIGRVNSEKRLLWAERIGADSVDGTGWLRDERDAKFGAFVEFFEGRKQCPLSFS